MCCTPVASAGRRSLRVLFPMEGDAFALIPRPENHMNLHTRKAAYAAFLVYSLVLGDYFRVSLG